MNEDEQRELRRRLDQHEKDIVNFNSAQNGTNTRLDEIDETLYAIDKALRGDVEGDRHGLVARMENVERANNKYHAILLEDNAGQKGLCYKVDALISGKMDAVERRKSRASVIIAIITSAALIITNLDRIGEFWIKIVGREKPDQLEGIINRAKHPHVRKIVPRRIIDYSESSSSPE